MPPYRTVASAALPLDARPKLLHIDLVSDHDEPRVGIAFELEAPPSAPDPGSEICIDDLVLRELMTQAR
ncbi:MAG TPA: hypothetical protein VG963_26020 [Polyangiaceae bacterium]|nr:hypothetical protein [Polyangiaceae bacterium]